MEWHELTVFLGGLVVTAGAVSTAIIRVIREMRRQDLRQTHMEGRQIHMEDRQDLSEKRQDGFAESLSAQWRRNIRMAELEAIDLGHLLPQPDGGYRLSADAARVFEPRAKELRGLRRVLENRHDRPPLPEEFGQALEMLPIQEWLLEEVCPAINTRRFGCLYIAWVVSCGREACAPAQTGRKTPDEINPETPPPPPRTGS